MKFYEIVLFWLVPASYITAYVINFSNKPGQVLLQLQNARVQGGIVEFALQHMIGDHLGEGKMGKTFTVSEPIDTYSAVIKIIDGHWEYDETQAEKEARNLYTVDQLLAWGATSLKDDDKWGVHRTWYFVMKNMGISEDSAKSKGMSNDEILGLKAEANKRYITQFKMNQLDPNKGNYVYHLRADKNWQAEIIDWHVGRWTDEVEKQPVNPFKGEVVKEKKVAVEL